MKAKQNKKEQMKIAKALLEMGMDFEVIEVISGITAEELFSYQINVDNKNDLGNNKKAKRKQK